MIAGAGTAVQRFQPLSQTEAGLLRRRQESYLCTPEVIDYSGERSPVQAARRRR